MLDIRVTEDVDTKTLTKNEHGFWTTDGFFDTIYLVFEYEPMDSRNLFTQDVQLSAYQIKLIMYNLLEGI